MSSTIEQCVYNELVQFVLEVVSSESYLRNIGIYRPKPYDKKQWESLAKKFRKKDGTVNIKPGIYPRRGVGGEVHYYAIREEPSGLKTIANGYINIGGVGKLGETAFGLDAQKNRSHNLCQTYALMYYNRDEKMLGKGEKYYFNNVEIGLAYLINFINEDYQSRERCWTIDEIFKYITRLYEECSDKDRRKVLNIIKKNNQICLTDLIIFIQNRKLNLEKWFE